MSTCSPTGGRASADRRRAAPDPRAFNPGLRVSDAERAEVADRLSKHYSDGRLDQAEFNERLDQAMKARTQADLGGLFADLPGAGAHGTSESRAGGSVAAASHGHRRPLRRILFLVLVIAIAAAVGQALAHSFVPWLLIGFLAFLWLLHGPWQHRRL